MPITQSAPNPYNADVLASTWSYCASFTFDDESQLFRMVYLRYADRPSAYDGKPPFGRVELLVTGAEFVALMAANAATFAAVKSAVDAYALAQAAFAGGAITE